MPRLKGSSARTNSSPASTGKPQQNPADQRRQKREGRYRDPPYPPQKGPSKQDPNATPTGQVEWLNDAAFRRYLELLGDGLYGRTPYGRGIRALLRKIKVVQAGQEAAYRLAGSNMNANAVLVAPGYSVCGGGGNRLVTLAGLCAWNGLNDVVGNSQIFIGSLNSRPSAFTARDYLSPYNPNPAFSNMTQRAAYTRTVVPGPNPYISSTFRTPGIRPNTPTNIWPWIAPLTPYTPPVPVPVNSLWVRPGRNSSPEGPASFRGQRPVARRNTAGRPKPPGPGVREKKGKSKIGAAVFAIMNAYTETDDLADGLYNALPGYVKAKVWANSGKPVGGLHAGQKLLAVYQNIKSLNVGLAVKNIIANQIEDAFYGRLSGGASKNLGAAGFNMAGTRLGGLGGGYQGGAGP